MNKVEVIQVFEDAIKNSNKFIGLMLEKEGAGPEISIVPGQNFIGALVLVDLITSISLVDLITR